METDEEEPREGVRRPRLLADGLTRRVIGSFFDVYNELGYGFLESVYRESLARALRASGLHVGQEVELRVHFRGAPVGSFRADLIVAHLLVVETKAVERLADAHRAQLRNYLRATDLEIGLLLNFGPLPSFQRLLFTNDRKRRNPSASVGSV